MKLEEFLENEVVDYDMDSNYIYLKLDKDKYDLPSMAFKSELRKWLLSNFLKKVREDK